MSHPVQFHYPNTKKFMGSRPVIELNDEEWVALLPASLTHHLDGVLLPDAPSVVWLDEQIRKRGAVIVVPSGSTVGDTVKDFKSARAKIRSWGGELVSGDELAEDRVREMFNEPVMQQALSSLPKECPVHVAPLTYPILPIPWQPFGLTKRGLIIYPSRDCSAEDRMRIASNIITTAMYFEGYAAPSAWRSTEASDWNWALFGTELNRRLTALGFDPVAVSDNELKSRTMCRVDERRAVADLVRWTLQPTQRPELRDQYLARLRQEYPEAQVMATRVIEACIAAGGARTPQGVIAALSQAEMLRTNRSAAGYQPFKVYVLRKNSLDCPAPNVSSTNTQWATRTRLESMNDTDWFPWVSLDHPEAMIPGVAVGDNPKGIGGAARVHDVDTSADPAVVRVVDAGAKAPSHDMEAHNVGEREDVAEVV